MTTELNVSVIAPLEFRFLDPADQAAHGDRWYLYDESAICRLPAQRLIDLEQATGHPVRSMMELLRKQAVLGDLLVTWTGVHLADPSVAGDFPAWSPLVFAVEWRTAELDDLGKDDAPSPEESDPTPTVALASLPAGE